MICHKSTLAILAACISLSASPALSQDKEVSLVLDWLASGRHAGWFTALEKGFYADEGLDVEISRGFGISDTTNRIRSGQADFAFNDIPSAIIARASEGAALKTVAVIYAKHPGAIFTHTEHGITNPEDLEGKRIADSAGSTQVVFFDAYAELAGFDASEVEWVLVAPDAKMQVFKAGEVHGVGFYNMQRPLLEETTAETGGVNMLEFGDYLQIYASGLITTDQYIEENPDVVEGFVRASMKGWDYAFEHPDEAVSLLQKNLPMLDPEVSKAELLVVQEMMQSRESEESGLGYMAEDRMRETRDLTLRLFDIDESVELDELYTNEFLPQE